MGSLYSLATSSSNEEDEDDLKVALYTEHIPHLSPSEAARNRIERNKRLEEQREKEKEQFYRDEAERLYQRYLPRIQEWINKEDETSLKWKELIPTLCGGYSPSSIKEAARRIQEKLKEWYKVKHVEAEGLHYLVVTMVEHKV
jgi:hypothetical protein